MKITIIHQYFKTPEEGGGIRSFYLAKYLLEQGCSVKVVTSWNKGHSAVVVVEGIEIHYLPIGYSNNYSFYKRKKAFLSYMLHAFKAMSLLDTPDLYYVISTPLSTGILGLAKKWTKGTPFIFEVGDIWPEIPIQMGLVKSRALRKLLYRLEKMVYDNALGVVAMSEPIAKHVQKVSKQVSIQTTFNLADTNGYQLSEQSNTALTIGYFGALGVANQVQFLLDVALESKRQQLPIKFIIAGEGKEAGALEAFVLAQGLDNVRMEGHVDKQSIRKLMDETDVAYISFADYAILGTGSPNKYFDALAAGKLIVINFRSWIEMDLTEFNNGFYYHPYHPEDCLKQLKDYIQRPELLKNAQQCSRILAETKYSLDAQLASWFSWLQKRSAEA